MKRHASQGSAGVVRFGLLAALFTVGSACDSGVHDRVATIPTVAPDPVCVSTSDQWHAAAATTDSHAAPLFLAGRNMAIGGGPHAVGTGDFDSDGLEDIVVTEPGAAGMGLRLLLNRRDGFFLPLDVPVAPRSPFSATSGVTSIAVGDLNDDGRPDVVVADRDLGTVTTWLNVGVTFTPSTYVAAKGTCATGVAIGDVDGDGDADIAASVDASCGRNDRAVLSIALNDGTGTFAVQDPYQAESPDSGWVTPDGARSVALGDLNGDGTTDVVLVDNGGALTFFLNRGWAGFPRIGTRLSTGTLPTSAVVGDIDGDGDADIVVASDVPEIRPGVTLLFNQGGGVFERRARYVRYNVSAVALRDLDTDGTLDLVLTGPGELGILFNDGKGVFSRFSSHEVGPDARESSVAFGDFNDDGRPDIAIAPNRPLNSTAGASGGALSILPNLGNGAFPLPLGPLLGGSVAVADFNGDGAPDLAAGMGDYSVGVLFNQQNGCFASVANQTSDIMDWPWRLAAADLDGRDGPDLVIVGGKLSVLLNRGDGTFAPRVAYDSGDLAGPLAVGDWNGDGSIDLAVLADTLGERRLGILLNHGDGSFARAVSYPAGPMPDSLAVGDVNGDGSPDVVTASRSTSEVAVLLNRGDGTFAAPTVYPAGGSIGFSLVLADLDSDGHLDLAIAGDDDAAVRILMNIGNGTFGPPEGYEFAPDFLLSPGGPGLSIATGDFNGDGAIDLAIGNATTASIALLVNDGAGHLSPTSVYAEGNVVSMTPADLNGDGRLDLAVGGKGVTVLLNTFP